MLSSPSTRLHAIPCRSIDPNPGLAVLSYRYADSAPDSVEHAYRQSMPDSYGVGLGMMSGMGGGMGINNLPGAQTLMYGRGMGYGGGVGLDFSRLPKPSTDLNRTGVVCMR